jgi:hypothetical protein
LCYFISNGDAIKPINERKVDRREIDHRVAKVKRTESNVENDEEDVLERFVPLWSGGVGVSGQFTHNLD